MARSDRARVTVRKSIGEGWEVAIAGPDSCTRWHRIISAGPRQTTKAQATAWAKRIREAIAYGYK